MSSTGSSNSAIESDSRFGWTFKPGRESDTAVRRYDRVAMLEAVLSIKERQQRYTRWAVASLLFLAGVFVIAAGILGW